MEINATLLLGIFGTVITIYQVRARQMEVKFKLYEMRLKVFSVMQDLRAVVILLNWPFVPQQELQRYFIPATFTTPNQKSASSPDTINPLEVVAQGRLLFPRKTRNKIANSVLPIIGYFSWLTSDSAKLSPKTSDDSRKNAAKEYDEVKTALITCLNDLIPNMEKDIAPEDGLFPKDLYVWLKRAAGQVNEKLHSIRDKWRNWRSHKHV